MPTSRWPKPCKKANVKQKCRGDALGSARPAASSRPSGYESAIARYGAEFLLPSSSQRPSEVVNEI